MLRVKESSSEGEDAKREGIPNTVILGEPLKSF